ncbi:hypothetical protein THSYN_24765 [Candidatus Thiodictyon syntrophicum]|uniref:Uncharacterized protein n=1 Tax=Candidatus Thiodictyon syntrophicum TaxID=1166950 RepID=A0A2K8UE33_9GAMM|nr:hypothetical protein THSYN_24765 [Candidatus Thiodictyon syntrophicum]
MIGNRLGIAYVDIQVRTELADIMVTALKRRISPDVNVLHSIRMNVYGADESFAYIELTAK